MNRTLTLAVVTLLAACAPADKDQSRPDAGNDDATETEDAQLEAGEDTGVDTDDETSNFDEAPTSEEGAPEPEEEVEEEDEADDDYEVDEEDEFPIAIHEGDTFDSPLAVVRLSPSNDEATFENEISWPEGDREDWFELTTIASQNATTRLTIDFDCSEDYDSVRVTIWQLDRSDLFYVDSVPGCGTEGDQISLDSNGEYLFRVTYDVRYMDTPSYIDYSLTVVN